MPLVSVIIPTYNRCSTVWRAVRSALDNGWDDLEVVICDDGSTDDTPRRATAWRRQDPGRVRYLRLPHSGLPAAARNAGCRTARGEFLAFLDSDDLWLPGKLDQQMRLLLHDPSIGLVSTNAMRVRDALDASAAEQFFLDELPREQFGLLELLQENFVITSSAVVRRAVAERTGYFCEDPQLRIGEDWDLWLRIAAVSKIRFLDQPLAVYRDAPAASIRGLHSKWGFWDSVSRIHRRTRQFLVEQGLMTREIQAVLQETGPRFEEVLLAASVAEGRTADAFRCCLRLASYSPRRALRGALRVVRLTLKRKDSRLPAAPRSAGKNSGRAAKAA